MPTGADLLKMPGPNEADLPPLPRAGSGAALLAMPGPHDETLRGAALLAMPGPHDETLRGVARDVVETMTGERWERKRVLTELVTNRSAWDTKFGFKKGEHELLTTARKNLAYRQPDYSPGHLEFQARQAAEDQWWKEYGPKPAVPGGLSEWVDYAAKTDPHAFQRHVREIAGEREGAGMLAHIGNALWRGIDKTAMAVPASINLAIGDEASRDRDRVVTESLGSIGAGEKGKRAWYAPDQMLAATAEMLPPLIGSALIPGGKAGTLAHWTVQIAPDAYADYRREGFSDSESRIGAIVSALPEAALEIYLGKLGSGHGKVAEGIWPEASRSFRHFIAQGLKRAPKEILKEDLEEFLQPMWRKTVGGLMRRAKAGDPQLASIPAGAWQAMLESGTDALHALGPLTLLMGGSAISGAGPAYRQAQGQQAIDDQVQAVEDYWTAVRRRTFQDLRLPVSPASEAATGATTAAATPEAAPAEMPTTPGDATDSPADLRAVMKAKVDAANAASDESAGPLFEQKPAKATGAPEAATPSVDRAPTEAAEGAPATAATEAAFRKRVKAASARRESKAKLLRDVTATMAELQAERGKIEQALKRSDITEAKKAKLRALLDEQGPKLAALAEAAKKLGGKAAPVASAAAKPAATGLDALEGTALRDRLQKRDFVLAVLRKELAARGAATESAKGLKGDELKDELRTRLYTTITNARVDKAAKAEKARGRADIMADKPVDPKLLDKYPVLKGIAEDRAKAALLKDMSPAERQAAATQQADEAKAEQAKTDEERLAAPVEPIKQEAGKTTTVYSEAGEAADSATYAVMELSDLAPSHTHKAGAFVERPGHEYPRGLQPRDYTAPRERDKVYDHAEKKVAAHWLSDDPLATGGPPSVSADGVVINGNGRVLTLQLSEENDLGGIDWYSTELADRAERFGISGEQLAKFKRPVLVRVVDMHPWGPEAKRFAGGGQYGGAQEQSPARSAAQFARMIDRPTWNRIFKTFERYIAKKPNGTFMGMLRDKEGKSLAVKIHDAIPAARRSGFFNADFALTDAGKLFVSNMVFSQIFDNNEAVDKMPPAWRQALQGSVVQLLAAREHGAKYDIVPAIQDAILFAQNALPGGIEDVTVNARRAGKAKGLKLDALDAYVAEQQAKTTAKAILDYYKQPQFFGVAGLSPGTRMMLDVLGLYGPRSRVFREKVGNYVDLVAPPSTEFMGQQTETPPKPMDPASAVAEAFGVTKRDGSADGTNVGEWSSGAAPVVPLARRQGRGPSPAARFQEKKGKVLALDRARKKLNAQRAKEGKPPLKRVGRPGTVGEIVPYVKALKAIAPELVTLGKYYVRKGYRGFDGWVKQLRAELLGLGIRLPYKPDKYAKKAVQSKWKSLDRWLHKQHMLALRGAKADEAQETQKLIVGELDKRHGGKYRTPASKVPTTDQRRAPTRRMFTTHLINPLVSAEVDGGVGSAYFRTFYADLREGDRVAWTHYFKHVDTYRAALKEHGVTNDMLDKASKSIGKNPTVHTIKGVVVDGDPLQLTTAERMELFLQYHDPHARESLFDKENPAKSARATSKQEMTLTEADFETIIRSMPKWEQAVAKAGQEILSGELYDVVREVYLIEEGAELPKAVGHWHIQRLGEMFEDAKSAKAIEGKGEAREESDRYWQQTKTRIEVFATPGSRSIFKERTGGRIPILFGDFFNTFSTMLTQMSAYAGKASSVYRARAVMQSRDFRQAMRRNFKYGEDKIQDIERTVYDFEGLDLSPSSPVDAAAGKWFSRFHIGMVGLKLKIALYQPVTLLNAVITGLRLGDLVKGFGVAGRRLGHGKKIMAEASAASPFLRERFESGGFGVLSPWGGGNTVRSTAGLPGGLLERLAMRWVQRADHRTILAIYVASKAEGARKGLKGAALREYAARRAEDATARSQPSWDSLTTPGIAREAKRSQVKKAFTMFTTVPLKNLNIAYRAVALHKRGEISHAEFVRDISIPIINAALVAVISDVFHRGIKFAWGAKDEKSWLDAFGEFVSRLLGTVPVLGDAAGYLLEAGLKGLQGKSGWTIAPRPGVGASGLKAMGRLSSAIADLSVKTGEGGPFPAKEWGRLVEAALDALAFAGVPSSAVGQYLRPGLRGKAGTADPLFGGGGGGGTRRKSTPRRKSTTPRRRSSTPRRRSKPRIKSRPRGFKGPL